MINVLVASLDGMVSMLNGDTGEVIWETKLPNSLQSTPVSMIIEKEQYIAVADTEGYLYLLNSGNGYKSLSTKIESADSILVSPIVMDINSDSQEDLILTSQNGYIFGLTITTP